MTILRHHTEGSQAFIVEADGTTVCEIVSPTSRNNAGIARDFVHTVNHAAALRDALDGLLTIFDEFDAANGCRWEDARREAALVVMAGAEA